MEIDEIKAHEFAKKNNVKMKIGKHFFDDEENRFIFNITLFRNKKRYKLLFGQSENNGDRDPTMYDILCCLEKYGYSSFKDFCSELCRDEDSMKAYKIYLDVCKEYEAVNRLFGDIMEELREIV